MSAHMDKELEKTRRNKQQLIREIDRDITYEMAQMKRARANKRSEDRANGRPCDPTTSETSETESVTAAPASARSNHSNVSKKRSSHRLL